MSIGDMAMPLKQQQLVWNILVNNPDITELYSFTSLPNLRSERVMQKIGMTRMKEFDHPLVPADHPLCKHVLYHIKTG